MAKTLRVIDSFFMMDVGDIFELSKDGNTYTAEHFEEYHKTNDGDGKQCDSSYSSKYTISAEYAKMLIEEGYLEEVNEKQGFVNIFDEIDALLAKYTAEYKLAGYEMDKVPTCSNLERKVVLSNLITLLEHLKGLKKQ